MQVSEQIMIQVRFKEKVVINGNETEYNDALYFTQEEYQAKSQSEIDMLKQERVTNWTNVIKNPPAFVEPTKAQLQEQKINLEAQLVDVNTKLLTAKDVVKVIG